ncbi:MAG: hypothetical protein Q8L54_16290 [Devosia sp.]|nr:hypothetical protein [Devosia sp.]
MNLDLSIHRMAVREAETLGVAQALVARKRQQLDLKLLREQVLKGEQPTGADVDGALKDMDARSRQNAREPAPAGDSGGLVDKTA